MNNDIYNTNYKITIFDDVIISPYHSKSVKTFFNSDNLVIKEIFYKDENCTEMICTIDTDYRNSKKTCTYVFADVNYKQITVFDKYNRVSESIIYVNNEKYVKAINKYHNNSSDYERIIFL